MCPFEHVYVCGCLIIRWFWESSLPEEWKVGPEDFSLQWRHHKAGDRCYRQCRSVRFISLLPAVKWMAVEVGNEGTKAVWWIGTVQNLWGHLVLWLSFCVCGRWQLQAVTRLHCEVSLKKVYVNKWATKGFRIRRMPTVSMGTSKGGKAAWEQSYKNYAKSQLATDYVQTPLKWNFSYVK